MQAAWSKLVLVTGLLLALVPRIGHADDPPAAETHLPVAESRGLLTPFGEYFLLGGGATNFIDNAVKSSVDVGGTWDLRLGFGSRFFVGAEAAYVGSARNSTLGSSLVTNGLEGVIRVQYPYVTGDWLIEPFGFGGAGWTHLKINSVALNTPALQDSDDVFVIPLGGGLTVAYDHFLFDGRFTYRQTFNESLVRAADGTPASLKNWAVTASVGYEF